MVKKIQYLFILAPIVALFVSSTPGPPGSVTGVQVIVIDPGHGGKDPGCQGASHKEKDIALSVALKLGKYIEQHLKGVKVIYTRTSDVFVQLEERAQIANRAKADLFISIHCNAAGKPVMVKDSKTGKMRPKLYKNRKGKWVHVETTNPEPYGSETYVMGLKNEEGKMKVATRENSAIFLEDDYEKNYGGFDPESEESYIIMSNYTSAYVIQSANLAMKIQEEYTRKAGRIDRGVHRQSIWVLWRTSMPSILTELGYLTNPLEEGFLASEKGQDYLAKAIFRGVRKYKDETEGVKREYNDMFENQEPLENENFLAKKNGTVDKSAESAVEPDRGNDETLTAQAEPKETTMAHGGSKQAMVSIPASIPAEEAAANTAGNQETNKSEPESTGGAKDIAGKFLKETGNSGQTATAEKEEPGKVLIKRENANGEEIIFKVQFAISDTEIDLKQSKFSCLQQPSYYKLNNLLRYTSGMFTDPDKARTHQLQLREKGFSDCFVAAFRNGQRIDYNEALRIVGR